eukprot:m.6269 g.6269  ORF g.6269 m.6269 type:complete len:247 (+) comp5036_c0_seq1:591-1331(+)
MIEDLTVHFDLSQATNVLLSGGSAGGLAAYLHADYVRTLLPSSVTRYKVSPSSGFFLNHTNFDNTPAYPGMIEYIFSMQNATAGVSAKCLSDRPVSQHFECMFAQEAYKYIKSPIFILQSQLDSWQLGNIYPDSKTAQWPLCIKDEFEQCNVTQIDELNAYGTYLLHLAKSSPTFTQKGNGGFFSSCLSHVAQQGSGWTTYKVAGTIMRDAAEKWWFSVDEEASLHTYIQPHLLQHATPHQTNPTC